MSYIMAFGTQLDYGRRFYLKTMYKKDRAVRESNSLDSDLPGQSTIQILQELLEEGQVVANHFELFANKLVTIQ